MAGFEIPDGRSVQAFQFVLDATPEQAACVRRQFGGRRFARNWAVRTLREDIARYHESGCVLAHFGRLTDHIDRSSESIRPAVRCRLGDYRRMDLPPLVVRAGELAGALGFPLIREEAGPGQPSACLPGVGRFLAMLAARCRGGRIAEIGTGAGIGTAWMAGAMPADCVLVTTEIDQRLAAAAADLLATDPRVEVLAGDAADLLPARAPFDLLFADGNWHDPAGLASLTGLLAIGGHIVMDDVTPRSLLPADSPLRQHDAKREFFFGDRRLISAEVVLPDLRNSLLVGTRHM